MARIGYLYLRDGRWGDAQLLPASWVARSAAGALAAEPGRRYGLGWWSYDGADGHVFEAVGRGGQRISVLPALDLVVVWTGGGFDPKELGDLLGQALVSPGRPLPPDPPAVARLEERLRVAASAPAPGALATPPPTAPAISGRRVELESNGTGIRALTFTWSAAPEARLELVFADRTVTLPVGLDGVGRFGGGLGASPTLARAGWDDDGSLRILLDLVAGINRYLLVLRPAGDELQVAIREATGLVNDTVRGRLAR